MADSLDVVFGELHDAAAAHDEGWGTGIQGRPEGSLG
jgi:hypothetical protein